MSDSPTPGPWKLANTLPRRSNFQPNARRVVRDDSGKVVAVAESRFRSEADANARLIAAAPALLEALDDMLSCYYGGSQDDLNRAVDRARSALAEARP